MKKLITAMLAIASIAPLSAQQLPNNGFEEPWVDCRPWTSANNTTVQGTTPKDWTASNVYAGSGLLASGNQTVAENVAGYNNSSSAIKVGSKSFTVFLYGKKTVPGYFTLGTTWSTSKANQNNDGGTFGGITFSSTPDAIEFQYMAQGGTSDVKPTVVAYLWNGTFIQKNVPGNIDISSLKTVDMIDRDLCVLGRSLDGHQGDKTLSEEGTLIASAISRPDIVSEWTKGMVSLEYKEGVSAKAEKFNVIFSAGDYFSTTPTEGCTMTVDDVKLLYYSRLKTLSVNGTEVSLKDGEYVYDLSESVYMPKSEEELKLSYTLLGESPAKTVSVALDAENNTATITVKNTNEGATDVDGEAEHVYTIKFKAPRVFTGIEYPGQITKLTMDMGVGDGPMDLLDGGTADASIWMTRKGSKRIVDVLLPDFTLPILGPTPIGDILVENVTRTYNNNNGSPIYDYTGHVDDLSLDGGKIHAVVDLEGTSDVEGNVNFKIHVKWDQNATQSMVAREAAEPNHIPIEVEFNGRTATPEVPTGINDVTVDGADAPVEYFDLQGIRVSNPQAGQMVIRRQGTNVEKILVK